MLSPKTTALVIAGLAMLAALGGAMGVPDARLTVDSVSTGPSDPVVGERTSVNVTVASSAGSADPANVSEIRLLDPDGEVRDVAAEPGALSPGDDLDATLWTTFDEPGEHRLTVEVVATEPMDEDADEEVSDDSREVTVQRDVVVDVDPAESTVDLRVRSLSPADLRDDDGDDGVDVGGLDGIDGLFGAGGGGLDADEDGPVSDAIASPVAVTVVNTGTVTADRVSVTASGTDIADDVSTDTASTDDSDAATVEAGPFVVEDVAPGEERRVVVDLGPLDRRSNVTFTAAFRADAGPPDAEGASGSVSKALAYPPRDGRPTITDTDVSRVDEDRFVVDASLANTGDRSIEGVVVDVAAADGVPGTPEGGSYFVGVLEESDFAPFEIEAAANESATDAIPLRIEYTDRGVRYVETVHVDLPSASAEEGDGGFIGTAGVDFGTGTIAIGVGVLGVIGLGAAVVLVRRRDV